MRAVRRDELRGGGAVASAATLRELRSAPHPFPDVPVTVLVRRQGLPEAVPGALEDLAAAAPQGRHIVVYGAMAYARTGRGGQRAASVSREPA